MDLKFIFNGRNQTSIPSFKESAKRLQKGSGSFLTHLFSSTTTAFRLTVLTASPVLQIHSIMTACPAPQIQNTNGSLSSTSDLQHYDSLSSTSDSKH
ncbi:hypothetical protein CHS0354_033772 [Potamilus streckersoni]|uniref:Uncharacterized protein n=1 Tax=Potamilus streckersoni TaxID=2493646 RepID=A0AAE0S296_9BIVA|nr:hypothetical protein CHS0354_033772 [Potamilus streckersoni]